MAKRSLEPTLVEDEASPPSSPRPLLRRSGKEPMTRETFLQEEDVEELPELGDYFDRFVDRPLDAYERIKICRAYASYLVTTIREQPKEKKSKK